ncbi:hypothetical protein HC031_25475 [Planosporangium thailandense]|uniref:Uncharacterized protein n=1 Tax=Planosporangium thailandense TaxID=765197 RepID=A0ABX0Y6J3_9ACTN|nr:hypothetical protein [Planosporangium thailandense]NJC73040.1 hypothetical protein [Planosporangium thailandense]
MKKKAALVLAAVVAALGIASAALTLSDKAHHPNDTKQASPRDGQVQAPPPPPRAKPLERVVVGSK